MSTPNTTDTAKFSSHTVVATRDFTIPAYDYRFDEDGEKAPRQIKAGEEFGFNSDGTHNGVLNIHWNDGHIERAFMAEMPAREFWAWVTMI